MNDLKDYYDCKAYLESFGYKEYDGFDFYNYIFPLREKKGELNSNYSKPNPVYLHRDLKGKRIRRKIMLDDTFADDYIEFIKNNDLALCGGISYRGRTNQLEHAQHMNALIIDLDGVGHQEMLGLYSMIDLPEGHDFRIPKPTFIVLSGTGIHLYYVLDEVIELFPNIKLQLKSLKYNLTFKIWKWRVSSREKNIQYQSINQSFRMVGSINEKHGNKIIAFKTGEKVSLDYLNSFAKEENRVDILKRFRPSKHTLEETKIKFPKWYENTIVKGIRSSGKWHIKKDVYEWWKNKDEEAFGGHRYFYLMCLAIYAYKCDVSKKELKKDMWIAFEKLKNVNHTNEFLESDVTSALEAYDKGLMCFTLNDIEKLSGIRIERNKRNYRKQDFHLKISRAIRDTIYPNNSWIKGNGRPKGAGTKELEVQEWQRLNPTGTKAQCNKETGLDPKTIRKFWQSGLI